MNYTANDLQTLSAGRAYREKIGMYLSADRQEAIDLGLRELIYNAQDEFEATHQKNAFVKVSIDTNTQEIQVEDNMRGIPVAIRDDGINSLTAAFLIPHSGAKHKEGVYQAAVGVNGQGNKIVCHTSKWLRVQVYRDGNIYQQSFHETDEGAVPDGDIQVIGKTTTTGTKITYIPSEKVYQSAKIDIENLIESLTMLSYFTRGLKIILNVDGDTMEFYSANGLADGLKADERIHKNIIHFVKDYENCSVELALQWNKKKGEIKPYANNLYVKDGGAFISGFKSSLTKTFNTICGGSFTGEQIRKGLDGFVSVKVHNVQFTNQQKSSLANPEARTATSAAITEALKIFAENNHDDFYKIVAILSKEQKADEAAERARNAILNYEKEAAKVAKQKMIISDKLKDAKKLGENSILAVVEGDSAGGSIANGRQAAKADNFGVLRLRGKVINCLNNSIEDILANTEVNLFLQALGITYGKKYDSKKLRYGKIGILTDADSDGSHIGLLIMALIIKLCPELIYENRLCWIRTPLFREGEGRNAKYYYTNEEMKNRQSTGGNIKRFKGLGELGLEDMKNTLFNEQNRRFDTISCSDEGLEELTALMGPSVDARKYFVMNDIDFGEL